MKKKNNSTLSARRTMHLLPMAWMPAAIACLALLASCGDLTDNDTGGTPLPDGKYPMAFTATVDGPAQTRATTDNSWAGGEEVAVQVGSEVKRYTAAAGGTLSAAGGVTPWYWQNTGNITVNAWYPYADGKPDAGNLKVKADQRGVGYGLSDYLEANDATVTFADPKLTFKHRTAKVVVTLKAGDGVSAGDVSGATVKFLNQTGVENGGTEVTPKSDNNTYAALLTPQRMQNQKFIEVTAGGNTYYYTPTGSEAELTGGKQYPYEITVSKNGLTVAANRATAWTAAGSATDVTGKTPVPGYSASDLKIGDYYYSDGTWSDGGYRKYADNSTAMLPVMPVLTGANGSERTVLGIVMKVGRDNSDDWKDTDTYKDKTNNTMSTIHGYVLALKDGNGGSTCQWGSSGTEVGTNQQQNTLFCGYSNTQTIKDYATKKNKNLQNDFPAAYHASDGYEATYASPGNSSGWFFPSAGQCWYWYQNSDVLKQSMDKAGGDGWQNYYWSSSEDSYNPADNAWCVHYYGGVYYGYKGNGIHYRVRSCLAF